MNKVNTKVRQLNNSSADNSPGQTEAIREGVRLLKQGQIVAFPTETVYGLGADATSKKAVQKIFKAKGRPADNPLIVHIAQKNQLDEVINRQLTAAEKKLLDSFWPGPLTVIFPRNTSIPDITTAGRDTVAVRMPSHPVARALIYRAELPVAAPSANTSGYPSPTTADHVYSDLKGKIPLIIDGGPCPVGIESTVLDLSTNKPVILRPGAITGEQISRIISAGPGKNKKIGMVTDTNRAKVDDTEAPPAPGMKYRHYSPQTPLIVVSFAEPETLLSFIEQKQYQAPGLLVTEETGAHLQNKGQSYQQQNESRANRTIRKNNNGQKYGQAGLNIKIMGSRFQPEEIARQLFSLLREVDRQEVEIILVEAIPEKGVGAAVMNRLYKAAREIVEI